MQDAWFAARHNQFNHTRARVNAPTVPSSSSKSYPKHLQSDGTDAEVARAYDVHPVTLSGWNTKLKETGPNAVGGSDEPKEKPDYEALSKRQRASKTIPTAYRPNRLSAVYTVNPVWGRA